MRLIETAISLTLIGYAASISIALTFSQKYDYPVSANTELSALSLSNIFGSFFQCLPSYGSISRSCIQAESGGITQITSLISSILLFVVINIAATLFFSTPNFALSSIVVVSITSMLKKIFDYKLFKLVDNLDGYIYLVTFIATVVMNVIYGLFLGFILCISVHRYRIFDENNEAKINGEKRWLLTYVGSESYNLNLEITFPLTYFYKDDMVKLLEKSNNNSVFLLIKSKNKDFEGCKILANLLKQLSNSGNNLKVECQFEETKNAMLDVYEFLNLKF